MYRRSKFMEILLEIREEMSREADYDVDLFAEMIRSGKTHGRKKLYDLNGANGKKTVSKKTGKSSLK
ncbi:MAG: hypothetical protein ABIP06_10170 [Pyrinomonadaceae bacterium]